MKKISAVILACSLGVAVQAQLIDSLTSGSTAPYVTTIILAQNGDGPLNFSSTGSGLEVSRVSSDTSAQQDLCLRNDYQLSVGSTLRVDVSNLGTSGGVNTDFGLAIASTKNPTAAVWTSGTADARADYLAMYLKPGNSEVGAIGFSGTSQVYSTHTAPADPFLSITGLWITETGANVYDVGYSTGSGDTTYASGITFGSTSVDQAVGFYGDLRATITSPADFTNLQLQAVPEPSTLAMCGLGVFGLLFAARRKK